MRKSEYKKQRKRIDANRGLAIQKLNANYCSNQIEYKKGDIISDGFKTILVDKIIFGDTKPFPKVYYEGKILDEKRNPKKPIERCVSYGDYLTLIKK